jgi:aminoglycoside phosphotransferase (APT) family kinase protein
VPLSRDPERRANSLANLRRGGETRSAGNRHAQAHGGYITPREDELAEMIEQIEQILPVRQEGAPPPADRFMVEELAKALTQDAAITRWLTGTALQARNPARVERAQDRRRALSRDIVSMLRELGLTPRSRLAMGVDVVRGMSAGEALQAYLDQNYSSDKRRVVDAKANDGNGTGDG